MISSILTGWLLALMTVMGQGAPALPMMQTNEPQATTMASWPPSSRPVDESPAPSKAPSKPWWSKSESAFAKPAPSQSPAPDKAPAPTGAPSEIAFEQICPGQDEIANTAPALVCLTSHARVFHGLAPINGHDVLMASAAAKAQDMLACGYGHNACGRAGNYWVKDKGYLGCSGENIAYGYTSPREVFIEWMESPGHRANILEPKYHDLGVAELESPRGPLWVMHLGGC